MKNAKVKKGTFRKILRYVRRYGALIALSVLFAAATVALSLYLPILIGQAIDRIVDVGQVDLVGIVRIFAVAALVITATSILQWIMNAVNNKITYQVVRDVRKEAFRKIEILPLSYLDSHPTGGIVSRVIADVDQFADGLLLGFTQLFTGILTIVGTLVFMLRLQPVIALVVVVMTPLSLFVARFIAKNTHHLFSAQAKARGEQTAYIDEMVGNQKVVRAFAREDESAKAFGALNDTLTRTSLKAIFFSSLTNPCTRFVNSLVYAAVALCGAFCVVGWGKWGGVALTVGGLSCLLTYANQYTKPFNEISGVIAEFQNALACADRIFELIEEEPQIPDGADAHVLTDTEGRVDLSEVAFSYTPTQRLIEGLSLCVTPGQRIAIVGPTGCGKTTLINLLMRFYDVKDGSIRVDGYDIRALTRHSLRSSYGMVLQDTWLMDGTIRENISVGRPDATEEEIRAAAKAAHAHSFIKRLPQGYDTVITESGEGMSQGQKQLLCIARVMLCRPPMLILDEATSSIDTRTERKIQDAFSRLMEGRTSFIVAHRLSTVRDADVILVMKDGNIIEQGDHETLLRAGGFYATLYHSQFETV